MVNKKEIKYIIDLAKLNLEEKKEENLLEDISSILDYMDILEEVEVKGVEPMGHVHESENILREDEGKAAEDDIKKKIIDNAPELKDNYFKVDTILNKKTDES